MMIAFLAVDIESEISMYFGTHLLQSPVQGLRSMLYRMVRAELFEPSDLDSIRAELEGLYNYELTY